MSYVAEDLEETIQALRRQVCALTAERDEARAEVVRLGTASDPLAAPVPDVHLDAANVTDPLSTLTPTELQTLHLLVTTHLGAAGIASRLRVSPNTTRSHIKNIYRKLGVDRRNEAVEAAKEMGYQP